MLLFPLYAVGVWLLVAHWRRRWQGAAVLATAVFLVLVLSSIYRMIARLAAIPAEGLLFLLGVTGGIVLFVGMFILCLPRASVGIPCARCGYDLSGLVDESTRCPECGRGFAARGQSARLVEPKPVVAGRAALAADRPVGDAQREDHQGQARDQRPAHEHKLGVLHRLHDRQHPRADALGD